MRFLHDPQTLAEVFSLYETNLQNQKVNPSTIAQTKTALVRYTLPGWGFLVPDVGKISYQTTQEGMKFMEKISIQDFANALNIQQKVYDFLGDSISGASKRNYRSYLKRMLDWCSNQNWWKSAVRSHSGKYAPRIRKGRNTVHKVRVTNRKQQEHYALSQDLIPFHLQTELDDWQAFLTEPIWNCRQDPPLRKVSALMSYERVMRFFGWLYRIKGICLEKLSLNQIIFLSNLEDKESAKKIAKKNISLIYEYLRWCRNTRKIHPRTESLILQAFVSVAKYIYHRDTDYPNIKRCQDVPIMVLLRDAISKTQDRAKQTPSPIDETKKWLDYPDFLQLVQQLKKECAERRVDGVKRSQTAIARSHKRYLIFAFFAYMPPDRQRTLRELEIGRTLVRRDNKWYIHLLPEDYKTGASYGEQLTLIPEILYPDLEQWLNKWRLVFNPDNNFVFIKEDGKALTTSNFSGLFKAAAYRLTGQALTPHMVRDVVVTHFQRLGKSDAEMASLAMAMRHSRKMQQDIYDRRTQAEKVAPAQNMMLEAAGIIQPTQK